MRRRTLLLLTALALALSACGSGGGSTAALEEKLDAQQEAVEALRGRVTQLTDKVETVQSSDPMTGLSQVSDRMDSLLERLEGLEAELGEQVNSSDTFAGATSTRLEEVSSDIDDLTQTISSLQTAVDQLRQRISVLEGDVADHESDPNAHGNGGPGGQ